MKQHIQEHPEHGMVITMAATVSLTAGAAYGHDDVTLIGRKRAEFVIEKILGAIRAARFPQADVLETKLARGDRGPEILAMIDRALDSVGDASGVVAPLIQGAFRDATVRYAQ
jgi:hypothetical protein